MKYSLFGDEMDSSTGETTIEAPLDQSTRNELPTRGLLFDPKRLSIFSPKPELKLNSSLIAKKSLDLSSSSPFSQSNMSIAQSATKRTRCELGPVPQTEQKWANQIAALNELNRSILANSRWKTGWGKDAQFAHGGIPMAKEDKADQTGGGILSAVSAKPRGFRANVRKLKMHRALTDEDRASLKKTFEAFIQHARVVDKPGHLPRIQIDEQKSQQFITAMSEFTAGELANRRCNFNQLQHEISSLIHALWIDLPLKGNATLNARERKKLLSKWLAKTVQNATNKDEKADENAPKRVFDLLATHNITEVKSRNFLLNLSYGPSFFNNFPRNLILGDKGGSSKRTSPPEHVNSASWI